MRNINQVTVVGHIGNPVELSQNGILNIALATSRRWTDKTTGERQETTEWHRIIFFGEYAKVAAKHLKKGASVLIQGKIQQRQWDNNGNKQTIHELIANEFTLLDKAMGCVNRIILTGNVGANPEIRSFGNGGKQVSIGLAGTDQWKDTKGEIQTRTDWHNLVFNGRQAEVVAEHVRKGDSLYVEGHLKTESWEGAGGIKKFVTKVIVDNFTTINSKVGQPA